MNRAAILEAIQQLTLLKLAGLEGAERREALHSRIMQLAGMLELARAVEILDPALLDRLEMHRADGRRARAGGARERIPLDAAAIADAPLSSDRLSRRLQWLRRFTAGLSRQAPRQARSVPSYCTVASFRRGRVGAQSAGAHCASGSAKAHHADTNCRRTRQGHASCALASPPIPLQGALGGHRLRRPAGEHNVGDYAPLSHQPRSASRLTTLSWRGWRLSGPAAPA
jgi:hypothetical protein